MLAHFAALGGHSPSHMALGYRYFFGEGVPESCETSLLHYEYAANEAAAQIEKRGYVLPLDRNRLSDDTAAAVRSSGAVGTEMDSEVSHEKLFLIILIKDFGIFCTTCTRW